MVGNACLDGGDCGCARKVSRERWRSAGRSPKNRRVVLAGRIERSTARTPRDRNIPIAEAFAWAEADHGLLGEVGSYNTPKDRHGDYRGGTIGASPAYSFTAHLAEVEVDPETGLVDVKHDLGGPRLRQGALAGASSRGRWRARRTWASARR